MTEANIRAAIALVYGPHSVAETCRSLKELLEVQINVDVLMIVMGDFNEI